MDFKASCTREALPWVWIAAAHIDTNPAVALYADALRRDYQVLLISGGQIENPRTFHDKCCVLPPTCRDWLRKANAPAGTGKKISKEDVQPEVGGPVVATQTKGMWSKWKDTLYGVDFFFFRALALHWNLLGRPRPRTIICIDGDMLPVGLLGRLRGIPYLYHQYEIWPEQRVHENTAFHGLLKFVERSGVRFSSMVGAASDVSARLLKLRYRLKFLRWRIVNMIPLPVERYADALTGSPVKLLYHGIFAPRRGLEMLVDCMREVQGSRLFLRGFGPLERQLRQQVTEQGLEDRIEFLPPVRTEDLARAAADFDAGLTMVDWSICNNRFAVGLKTFENLTAGLALLLPASWPLRRIVAQKRCGLLYRPGDRASLLEALRRLSDPVVVSQLKEKSRYLAREEYTRAKSLETIREALLEIRN